MRRAFAIDTARPGSVGLHGFYVYCQLFGPMGTYMEEETGVYVKKARFIGKRPADLTVCEEEKVPFWDCSMTGKRYETFPVCSLCAFIGGHARCLHDSEDAGYVIRFVLGILKETYYVEKNENCLHPRTKL